MKYMKIALLPCCKLIFVTKSKLHNSSQKILTTSNLGIIYFLSFFSAETILLAIPSVSYNWINKRPLSLLDNTHLLRHTLNWIGDLPLPQDTISPHYNKDSCTLIISELKLKVNCRKKLGLAHLATIYLHLEFNFCTHDPALNPISFYMFIFD